MLLLVDAGNTRVKWALIDDPSAGSKSLGRWNSTGSVDRADVSQLASAWRGSSISRVMLSNVAGAVMRDSLTRAVDSALGSGAPVLEWFISSPALAGVRNGYRDPSQLGCDRFAAAIGAHKLFPEQNLIIATCGTATTIDAVSADGLFVGGMILPGLGLMAASLAKDTAQLPQVAQFSVTRGGANQTPFADNTDDAIVSGCIAAQAGAIERAVAALGRQRADAPMRCLLSGGAAALIEVHLLTRCERVDNLVLIGLHAVAIHCVAAG